MISKYALVRRSRRPVAGQLKGALDHYGEAMHIRRDVLGDKHPKTLQSIGKMVSWWQNFLKFGAIFLSKVWRFQLRSSQNVV